MKTELELLCEIAKKRGGKLLSEEYVNNSSKIKFECFYGHAFEMSANCVKRGQWCPKCKTSHRLEDICRLYFEHIFNSKFIKIRPEWLIGNSGHRLELDGYSSDKMVAFEYNGAQHYKKTAWFADSDIEKAEIKEQIKIRKCKEQGVALIIISYRVKAENFLEYIKNALCNLGYPIENLNWTHPSLESVYTNKMHLEKLKKDLEPNFELINSEYRGETFKYTAKCVVCGCERNAVPGCLRLYNCKRCSDVERKTIEHAVKIAEFRNGKCLSKEYINNSQPLQWQCQCNNIWDAPFNRVEQGAWCPKCGNEQKRISVKKSWEDRKITENIDKLKESIELAEKNGFKLLSTEYKSCDDPLIFLCAKGHKWKIGVRAFKRTIKEGRFCTECRKDEREA